jgi:hypothetical protein
MTKATNQQSQVTTLDDAPAAAAPAAAAKPAEVLIQHTAELSGKRKILTIHAEQGEGGAHAVFLGLNGVGYQVPRAKPFNVPSELVENLKNASQIHYERNDAGAMVPRESPRFAYTVEDAPASA